jgi:CBS domain-containing protein
MQVRDVMTENPVCCPPDASLQDVARMMAENDCGEIPIVDGHGRRPVGVITDRDITVRSVAKGRNPLELVARDCMTTQVVTVQPEDSVEDCCQVMETHQIRRVPVVDKNGCLCGIVSQADVALHASESTVAEVVKEVSR